MPKNSYIHSDPANSAADQTSGLNKALMIDGLLSTQHKIKIKSFGSSR